MKLVLLGDVVVNAIHGAVNGIIQWFYGLLFEALRCFKDIFDFCYVLVRKLAGIDTYYYKGVEMGPGVESSTSVTGDIIEVLLKTDIVRNLFISLLVLGIILLGIVTFVSIWKTEWNFDKDGNSKSKIWNSVFKALFNFIAVPVIALFGIFVGNALLRAINGATGAGEDVTMSDMVFTSLMTNAVRVDHQNKDFNYEIISLNSDLGEVDGQQRYGIYRYFTNTSGEIDRLLILQAFKENWTLSKKATYHIYANDADGEELIKNVKTLNEQLENGTLVFSFDNKELVEVFFDTSEVNYILGYLVLIIMTSTMLTITYGLVKRLFYILILFIVSPPIVAMSPINSKIMDGWRGMFIGNVCSAYVTIAIYNIFMSIYPLFENISLFPNTGLYTFFNSFVSLLFVCVGLLVINSLQAQISALFIGKDNDLFSNSTDKGKSLWGGAFGMAGKALAPTTIAPKAVGKTYEALHNVKYHGLGETVKGLGKDAVRGATGLAGKAVNAGPLSDMWKSMKVKGSLKNFENVREDNKKMGVKDTRKVKNDSKDATLKDFKAASSYLGYDYKSVNSKGIKSTINNLRNDTDLIAYNESKGIVDSLKADIESGKIKEGSADYQKYKDANTALSFMDKDKHEQQNRMIQAYDDYNSLKKMGTTRRLVKENNNLRQSIKNQGKANEAKDAVARRAAINDVDKKVLVEQNEKLNEILQEHKASKNKLKTELDLNNLKTEINKISRQVSNSDQLDKLIKKIDSALNKINKKK